MIPTTLVIASHNQKKVEEMHRILEQAGLRIEILGTDSFPDLQDVEET